MTGGLLRAFLPPPFLTYFLARFRILRKFKRFPRLRELDVEGCFQLTDAGMATLGSAHTFNCVDLRVLTAICCRHECGIAEYGTMHRRVP